MHWWLSSNGRREEPLPIAKNGTFVTPSAHALHERRKRSALDT